MYTVILCHGDFPRRARSLEALRQADHLVCCDGAMEELEAWGLRRPDAIVGDLDSLHPALKRRYSELLHPEAEQLTNDLSKALRFCQKAYPGEPLLILGAGGRREDHLLGNLAILAEQPDAELWTDFGRFLPCRGDSRIAAQPGDQLSLFSLDPDARLSLEGVRWPLSDATLARLWEGTLNEVTESPVRLQCPENGGTLVYLPWRNLSRKDYCLPPQWLPWNHVHFCGIGGVGVSGLAHLLLDAGASVSGSDAVESSYTAALRERGAQITVGRDGVGDALPQETDLLVYSAAIPEDHPERRCARSRGIPQCRRGEFLARLAPRFRYVIAVAGSHGKTSTSAMIAHVLQEAGMNPGFLIGGTPVGWERNARWGNGNYFVTEVDESDRSQEMMLPQQTIVLNVDGDHSWSVGGEAALEACFRTLASHSHRTLSWNTPRLAGLFSGLEGVRLLSPDEPESHPLELLQPGRHNRENACLVREVLQAPPFSLSEGEIRDALATFPGVDRRLSLLAQKGDALFLYEDYAHHPTELAACFQALKEAHPECRFLAVFQPHRPERILKYGDAFAEILERECARTVVLAPFMAWEKNAPEASADRIVRKIRELRGDGGTVAPSAVLYSGAPAEFLPELQKEWECPSEGHEVIVLIGAGDVGLLAKKAKALLNS